MGRSPDATLAGHAGLRPLRPHSRTGRWPGYGRRDAVAAYLAGSFTAAKQVAYDELARTAALSVSLPFVREEHERAVALMGPDYWSYGLEANRHVLSAFARYAAGQHLIGRIPEPADLFVPETGEEFAV